MKKSAVKTLTNLAREEPEKWIEAAARIGPPARAGFLDQAHVGANPYALAKYLHPKKSLYKAERHLHADQHRYASVALGFKLKKSGVGANRHYMANLLAKLPPQPSTSSAITQAFLLTLHRNEKLRKEYVLYCARWNPQLEPADRYSVDTFLRYLLHAMTRRTHPLECSELEWRYFRELAFHGKDFGHRTKAANLLCWHPDPLKYADDLRILAEELNDMFQAVTRKSETPINLPIFVLPWLPSRISLYRQPLLDVLQANVESDWCAPRFRSSRSGA